MHLPIFFAAAALLWALATASLSDNGRVTTLNDVPYYVSGVPVATLSALSSDAFQKTLPDQDLFPLTVIRADAGLSLSVEDYNLTLSKFRSDDDVYQDGFLQAVYISQNVSNSASLADCTSFSRETYSTSFFMTPNAANVSGAFSAALSTEIPNGPYFVSTATGNVFKTYRLYRDDYMAFTQSTISDERGGFLSLPAATANLMTRSVAVPSRLYYTPSASQPLAGLRFAVKDIFHVKGLKTSGGNRAYYDTYGVRNTTAASVQRLVDLGGVLVGKTGLAQFANGDRPTADWVDLHPPFNPRGDGYQDPSGSSTGSGAAVAAYAWLDAAVGSDTGGSMRGPAAAAGVFGNRPSTGAVSLDDVVPLSPRLDTAGVFARSAALWSNVTRLWYRLDGATAATADSSNSSNIYVSRASADPETPVPLFSAFLARLEAFLNATTTVVDVRERWNSTHQSSVDVDTLLNLTYGVFTAVDQYALLGARFLADHAALNAGALPYVNPNPRERWAWGQRVTANASTGGAVYADAVRNATAFRGWWAATFFPPAAAADSSSFSPPDDGDGDVLPACSSRNLYVYLQSPAGAAGTPSYRDEYLAPQSTPPLGFGEWTIAGWAGAPEVVLPIGEVEYQSRVTGRTEWLPVAVNVMAGRGCDGWLAGLVEGLAAGGVVLGEVRAGARV